ncbi:MAG: mechanosensitive ion channel family protein [Gammaproteobacteria bacterium]
MDMLIQNLQEIITLNSWTEAGVIVLLGLVLAKLADLFLVYTAGRIVKRTSNNLDDKLLKMLHRPLFSTFFIFGLIIACRSISEELGPLALPLTVSILQTIIILSWLRFLLHAAESVIETMGATPRRFSFAQTDTVPLLKNLAIVFLLLAGAYAILIAWDINVTGLVASAGIVGLALSFAAQDTLSHLFAGVAILADRPYRIGDFIVLDTGERGKVTQIGLRSTRLMTRDDVEVSIPNGVMGSAKIVNESGGGVRRFRIRANVGVAYGSDVNKVLEILEAIGKDTPDIVPNPAPRARFRTFGTSSLDFELLVWISDPEQRGLRIHEINLEIYRRFSEEGIIIPFPQQDVWIRELPRSQDHD